MKVFQLNFQETFVKIQRVRLQTIILIIIFLLLAGCASTLSTESDLSQRFGQEYASFLAIRFIDIKGVATQYADEGRGEAVLFIHGFPETLQGWRKTLPGLAGHFRVLVPDIIGSGGTEKPDIKYTPQELATFLRDFLDALGIERAHIVDADTGLVIGVTFAALYPERTERLVIAAGTVFLEDMNSWEVKLLPPEAVACFVSPGRYLVWALRNNYFPAKKHNLLLSDGFAYGNHEIVRSRQFCWSVSCLHIIEG